MIVVFAQGIYLSQKKNYKRLQSFGIELAIEIELFQMQKCHAPAVRQIIGAGIKL